jgi:hypothetical protein
MNGIVLEMLHFIVAYIQIVNIAIIAVFQKKENKNENT